MLRHDFIRLSLLSILWFEMYGIASSGHTLETAGFEAHAELGGLKLHVNISSPDATHDGGLTEGNMARFRFAIADAASVVAIKILPDAFAEDKERLS